MRKRIIFDVEDFEAPVVRCSEDKKLAGTAALEYIKWGGESENYHR